MKSPITFTLEGAEIARDLIDESFQFAVNRWKQSVNENNRKQIQYWHVRVVHFMNELNWIDCLLINLKPDPYVHDQGKITRECNG
jgi:hypothetical protein